MRLLTLTIWALLGTVAAAQETVIVAPPRSTIITAQDHAVILARRGAFHHSTSCGAAEGIGMSPTSADDAIRRCCYWGHRRPRDIGTAWCPSRRMWIAVVRYW